VLTGMSCSAWSRRLQCSRHDWSDTKGSAKGSGTSAAAGRTRSVIVVAEIDLSVGVLVGASLTIRGFLKRAKYRARLSTPTGAHGGVAISTQAYVT